MEKFKVDPNDDIASEPYKGPGRVVTSAGYIYLSHILATIAGFVGFAIAGAVAHTQTNKVKQWAEMLSDSRAESSGIKKGFASAIAFISKIAETASHKVFSGLKALGGERFKGKSIGEEKMSAALFAGGAGAIAGWVGSTIWGVVKGSNEGNRGKRQFERAKVEIKDLRERNDDLEKINDKLHEEVVEASTKFKDISSKQEQEGLRVAPDSTPVTSAKESADMPAETHAPSASILAAQHEGKLHAEHAAQPAMA